MKYIVSFILCGVVLTSPLIAQNYERGPRVLDQEPVITATAEDDAANISSKEIFLMDNATSDYAYTVWSRDIYRQIAHNVDGNETFFYPAKSTDSQVNLFSLLINLTSTNALKVYKYTAQPDWSAENILPINEILNQMEIPSTINRNNTVTVRKEDIPTDKITYYLIKEKWHFDIHTNKGGIKVEAICPVLEVSGGHVPLFWVAFDDISAYLARAVSPVKTGNTLSGMSEVSMFDVINNRFYRGCIYQVGYRHLSRYFPEMQDLSNARERIENELDFIQAKFYEAQNRR